MEENRNSRPRSRSRLYLAIGAGLAALALIAVLIPAILSTSWGKGFLESKLSKSLQMPISFASCSLGWRSPTQLRGIKAGPNEQGMRCAAASVEASFTVWDWLWDGEELRVEILRPEITMPWPLPSQPEPKPPETSIAEPEQPKPAPVAEESRPLPFRKLKLSLREGMVKVVTERGDAASVSFDLAGSLLAQSMEGSAKLEWKGACKDFAVPTPSSAESAIVQGEYEGAFSSAFNRAGVDFKLEMNARNLRASALAWKTPLEESLLEISAEGRGNLLLGEGRLKAAANAKASKAEIEINASASERFQEWKIKANANLLLDPWAPLLAAFLPPPIPCEGPLEAEIDVKLPRRHPERAKGTIHAAGKLDGKSWQLAGNYDGSTDEPRIAAQGRSEAIPVRPAFLSTLAYPIPLLASKDSHLLRMESSAGGDFYFEARGLDWARLRQSLKGEAHLTLPGGSLAGPSALAKILPAASRGALRFEKIDAPFRIENALITTPGIVLEFADTKLTMKGTTSFEGAIDYTMQVELPEKLKEKGWGAHLEQLFGKEGLPVGLTGTVDDPKPSFRMPEWKDVGKELLQEGIEALKKRRKKD